MFVNVEWARRIEVRVLLILSQRFWLCLQQVNMGSSEYGSVVDNVVAVGGATPGEYHLA